MTAPLGWFGIVRLGLVQAALGAIVVLVTSTLNRVMVVELALPAVVPGLLIALHYGVQLLRPRWGFGSDATGRRTPWILGGMAVLALGGLGAAAATAAVPAHPVLGLAGAVIAFTAVGLGVGAAGTSLLVLAATRVESAKRPVAAPLMWIMMIAGFAVTAGLAGASLDPFSMTRLLQVMATACGAAFALACVALWGLEGRAAIDAATARTAMPPGPGFRAALRQIWAEPTVRRFTLFVFVSMLAYSAQDLVLEPFAGAVMHLPPGGTTKLSGVQHGGALLGMIAVALAGGTIGRRRPGLMGPLAVSGCLLSAAVLCGIAAMGFAALDDLPLRLAVFVLGFGNGAFTVAAVGAMMALAAQGTARREGLRMGVWGAAQAAAFGFGSFVGPAMVDLMGLAVPRPGAAYGCVFLLEAILFVVSATLARGALMPARVRPSGLVPVAAEAA